MAIDILTLGSKKTRKDIDGQTYNNNPRNNLRYYVKFEKSDIKEAEGKIEMVYRVIQMFKLTVTNEWVNNISYLKTFVANKTVYVDNFGTIKPYVPVVPEVLDENGSPVLGPDPTAWGTEYDFLYLLLSVNDANGSNMTDYQKIIFDRGVLDRPDVASI